LSDDYIECLPNNNHLIKNTLEILEYLKPKYHLHIITNGFQEVQNRKLANSKIDHFFTHIVNSEMAGAKKPHPVIFEMALKKANVSPEKSMMIGDSYEADILGAKNIGMHTIYFKADNDSFNHDKLIYNLLEIKSYL